MTSSATCLGDPDSLLQGSQGLSRENWLACGPGGSVPCLSFHRLIWPRTSTVYSNTEVQTYLEHYKRFKNQLSCYTWTVQFFDVNIFRSHLRARGSNVSGPESIPYSSVLLNAACCDSAAPPALPSVPTGRDTVRVDDGLDTGTTLQVRAQFRFITCFWDTGMGWVKMDLGSVIMLLSPGYSFNQVLNCINSFQLY